MRFNGKGKTEDVLSCLFEATPALIMLTIMRESAISWWITWSIAIFTGRDESKGADVHQSDRRFPAVRRKLIDVRENRWPNERWHGRMPSGGSVLGETFFRTSSPLRFL